MAYEHDNPFRPERRRLTAQALPEKKDTTASTVTSILGPLAAGALQFVPGAGQVAGPLVGGAISGIGQAIDQPDTAPQNSALLMRQLMEQLNRDKRG